MDYIYTSSGSFVSCNELHHSGVKGMKWGVRKRREQSGIPRQNMRPRNAASNDGVSSKARAKRIAKAKRAAKIGAVAATAALAAYGAYKLNKYVRTANKEIRIGQKLLEANNNLNLLRDGHDYAIRNNKVSNDTIKALNDRFNSTAKRTLNAAVVSGANQASKDSFVTAVKNVYNYQRSKRR